jgi:hypothetical protein
MENLMTYEELASEYEVTVRAVKRWVADTNIEPVQVVQGTGGRPKVLFDKIQLDEALVALADLKHVEKLSDTGKIKFMIGHVELEGTSEQRDALRAYIDVLKLNLELKDDKIRMLDETIRDKELRLGKQSIQLGQQSRQYEQLLRMVPAERLSQEERDWLAAPTVSEFCRKFGIR